MMNRISIYNEFEIIQNNLLGVHALHEFVLSYTENAKGVGPKLYQTFPVLPMLFNSETTQLIFQKNMNVGSFFKVFNERNDIFINLQERMEGMSKKTFDCIRIAHSSDLFSYDRVTSRLFILRSTSIYDHKKLSDNYQKILFSARRIGSWFSKLEEGELLFYLNLKF